jgi:hypothetical protein
MASMAAQSRAWPPAQVREQQQVTAAHAAWLTHYQSATEAAQRQLHAAQQQHVREYASLQQATARARREQGAWAQALDARLIAATQQVCP